MPASSPGEVSSTELSKPLLSAHRRYIRTSISAQSCDSTPPAPGVYGDYGVPSVVLAGERQPQLQFIQLLGKLRDLLGQCVLQGVIPLFERERDEPIYGLGLRLQTPPELDVFLVT